MITNRMTLCISELLGIINFGILNVIGLRKRLPDAEQIRRETVVLAICKIWMKSEGDSSGAVLYETLKAPVNPPCETGYSEVHMFAKPLLRYKVLYKHFSTVFQYITFLSGKISFTTIFMSLKLQRRDDTEALQGMAKSCGRWAILMGDMNVRCKREEVERNHGETVLTPGQSSIDGKAG